MTSDSASERILDLQRSLRLRQDSTSAKQQLLLQAEAELMETSKRLEIQERFLRDRRSAAETRSATCLDRELDLERRSTAKHRDLQAKQDEAESKHAALEDSWIELEDLIKAHDVHVDAEKRRLKTLLADADARESALRERQRALTSKERDLEGRRRRLDQRAALLRDLDVQKLDRLKSDLQHREALFSAE